MNLTLRITTALLLALPMSTLSLSGALLAQDEIPAPAVSSADAVAGPSAEAPADAGSTPATLAGEATGGDLAAGEDASARQHTLRHRFGDLLRRHPQEVATILSLDPSLLHDDVFLARYPELARFVGEHPEVRRNPHFYLQDFGFQAAVRSPLDGMVEAMMVFASFLLVALALAWLVRTVIEQKRWNRLSRTQTEVHTKILDRFGSSEELLAYIRTPAGARFLESAPIPLHAEREPHNAPVARAMWSIQIGVVVAAAALGMLLVSLRFEREAAESLFALGAIGLCLGLGFVASAAVSLYLSRRLGLWTGAGAAATPAAGDADDLLVG